jgi:hypothetical protein
MADEAKVTPEEEKISPEAVETPKEGTVEAEIAKITPESPVVETKESQSVPLPVYLSLKDDVKELKRELKEAKESRKPAVILEGLKDLAEKYPDVSQEFIQDIITSATSKAQLEIEKKYTPILQKQEMEKQKEAFDKAFDKVFDKALKENPDLPDTIDKEVIKALAVTPAYRNVPISDILTKIYGTKGKASSENEVRTAADASDTVIDFSKITAEQKKQVMDDPKARAAYFKYLDTLP